MFYASKTACRGFKSFCPCQLQNLKNGLNTAFKPFFFAIFAHLEETNWCLEGLFGVQIVRFFDTNRIKVVAYSIKIASIFCLLECKNARNSFSELRVFFESPILCLVSLSTFQCKMLHYKLTAKNCKREKIASKIPPYFQTPIH